MLLDRRNVLQSMAAAGMTLPLLDRSARAQSAARVLRIGLSDYPNTLRPAFRSSGYATNFCWSLMHARLLRYDTNGSLIGELAESCTLEDDSSWTVKLRRAQFSNGDSVTSADLRYSLERMASAELSYSDRALYETIVRIDTPDELTARIFTATPSAAIPAILAMPTFFVLAANSDRGSLQQGIGAGPYILRSFERGVGLNYERNPHYFKGPASFDSVRVRSYLDENLRVAALLAGDVDLIDYVPWNSMSTIEAATGCKLQQESKGGFMGLYFSGRGPFADARLRKAVAFAIRREEIVQAVFYGRGSVMRGLPRPQVGGFYHEDLDNYWSYDPELSKRLLREAGVADGFRCTLLSSTTYGFHRDTAVLVQNHLAEIGIRVTLLLPDWATRHAMAQRGEGDLGVAGSGLDTLDPVTSVIDPSQPPGARSHSFVVPGLAELNVQGFGERDPVRRRNIYRQIDQLLLDNTVYCGLAYRATGFGHTESLRGFRLLPSLLSPFSYLHADEWSRA